MNSSQITADGIREWYFSDDPEAFYASCLYYPESDWKVITTI